MSEQTMSINDVVTDLANYLSNYANLTIGMKLNDKGEIDMTLLDPDSEKELKALQNAIAYTIKTYQPGNDMDGIFQDIVSVINKISNDENPELGNQFDQMQFNILNDTYIPLQPRNIKDLTYYQAFARRILLGKIGMQLFYERAKETVEQTVNITLDRINNFVEGTPSVNIPHMEDIMDFLKETTISAIDQIETNCNETIKPQYQKVIDIFYLIKHTALQLLGATSAGYVFEIWPERKQYVNDNGELVNNFERIHLDNIISILQKTNCRKIGNDSEKVIASQPQTGFDVSSIADSGKALTTDSYFNRKKGGKSKKRRKSGKRKTRRKQKKRKTRRKRRCKK